MAIVAVFRGDAATAQELIEAIGRNCTCELLRPCAAHLMLHDQKLIDRLLFARWLVERLVYEENRHG